MTKVTGKCDICNKVYESNNPANLARTIGVHRRFAHGVRGKSADRNERYSNKLSSLVKARAARWGKRPLSKDPRALASRNRYRAMKQAKALTNGTLAASQAVPCNLPQCPECGARFYVVRGQ